MFLSSEGVPNNMVRIRLRKILARTPMRNTG